jgi:anti-sigma-K factor RskA
MTFADKLAAVKLGQAARADYCEAEVMELVRAAEEREAKLRMLVERWTRELDKLPSDAYRQATALAKSDCAAELRRILES